MEKDERFVGQVPHGHRGASGRPMTFREGSDHEGRRP
jgi:hypothetical protein